MENWEDRKVFVFPHVFLVEGGGKVGEWKTLLFDWKEK